MMQHSNCDHFLSDMLSPLDNTSMSCTIRMDLQPFIELKFVFLIRFLIFQNHGNKIFLKKRANEKLEYLYFCQKPSKKEIIKH